MSDPVLITMLGAQGGVLSVGAGARAQHGRELRAARGNDQERRHRPPVGRGSVVKEQEDLVAFFIIWITDTWIYLKGNLGHLLYFQNESSSSAISLGHVACFF